MDDPTKIDDQSPDYVEDKSGSEDPENQPNVGTDPMGLPTEGIHKPVVHLDEEKVRKHDAETE